MAFMHSLTYHFQHSDPFFTLSECPVFQCIECPHIETPISQAALDSTTHLSNPHTNLPNTSPFRLKSLSQPAPQKPTYPYSHSHYGIKHSNHPLPPPINPPGPTPNNCARRRTPPPKPGATPTNTSNCKCNTTNAKPPPTQICHIIPPTNKGNTTPVRNPLGHRARRPSLCHEFRAPDHCQTRPCIPQN